MLIDKFLKIERFRIMKKSTVRIFAMVLAALMVLSLLPLAYAHAEEKRPRSPLGLRSPASSG